MSQNLKVGDRVMFNVGREDGPQLMGIVEYASEKAIRIRPLKPVSAAAKFFNIKKVEEK